MIVKWCAAIRAISRRCEPDCGEDQTASKPLEPFDLNEDLLDIDADAS
jgi:hypothetical protein